MGKLEGKQMFVFLAAVVAIIFERKGNTEIMSLCSLGYCDGHVICFIDHRIN